MTNAGFRRATPFLPGAVSRQANAGSTQPGWCPPEGTCVRSRYYCLVAPSPRGSPRRWCLARTALLQALFPDMPQGRAKKIQFQLLLADLSLQFVDPSLGLGRIRKVY